MKWAYFIYGYTDHVHLWCHFKIWPSSKYDCTKKNSLQHILCQIVANFLTLWRSILRSLPYCGGQLDVIQFRVWLFIFLLTKLVGKRFVKILTFYRTLTSSMSSHRWSAENWRSSFDLDLELSLLPSLVLHTRTRTFILRHCNVLLECFGKGPV